jgi:hypothetical protein
MTELSQRMVAISVSAHLGGTIKHYETPTIQMENMFRNRHDIAIALDSRSLKTYIHAIGMNYNEMIGVENGGRRRERGNADAWSNTNGAARRGGRKRRGRRPKRQNRSYGDNKLNVRQQRLSVGANSKSKSASEGDRNGNSLSGNAWKRRQRSNADVARMPNERD